MSVLIYKFYSKHEIDWSPQLEKKIAVLCHETVYKSILNISKEAKSELKDSNHFEKLSGPLIEKVCKCFLDDVKGPEGKLDGVKEILTSTGELSSEFKQKMLNHLRTPAGNFLIEKCSLQGAAMDGFLALNELKVKTRFSAICVEKTIKKDTKSKYSKQYAKAFCECTFNNFFDVNKDLLSLEENSTTEKRLSLSTRVASRLKRYGLEKENNKRIYDCKKESLLKLPKGAEYLEWLKKKNNKKN